MGVLEAVGSEGAVGTGVAGRVGEEGKCSER